MKVYTRKGDHGETSIWGGIRVAKESLRMEALGQVDVCSASVGAALAHGLPDDLSEMLARVQDDLYVVGCELMAPDATGSGANVPRLTAGEAMRLERQIDGMTDALPALGNFIHPGGTPGAAVIHVARAACRTAERRVHELSRGEPVSEPVAVYLNRLADFLFTAARYANHVAGVPERLSRLPTA